MQVGIDCTPSINSASCGRGEGLRLRVVRPQLMAALMFLFGASFYKRGWKLSIQITGYTRSAIELLSLGRKFHYDNVLLGKENANKSVINTGRYGRLKTWWRNHTLLTSDKTAGGINIGTSMINKKFPSFQLKVFLAALFAQNRTHDVRDRASNVNVSRLCSI